MEEAEKRLQATYRRVLENAYIRVMAHTQGRTFSDVGPRERVAITNLFEDAINTDVTVMMEVGQQFKLLGHARPPSPEDEAFSNPLVLDTEDEG